MNLAPEPGARRRRSEDRERAEGLHSYYR